MVDSVPYDEIEIWNGLPSCYLDKFEFSLKTRDASDVGYLVEVDMLLSEEIKEKTKVFPLCPKKKIIPQDEFTKYMEDMKPKVFTANKKLFCDWIDKKDCLNHYTMLKFYVRHEMGVDNAHDIISFRQSDWLEG